ncbi:MAG: ABC transporter ATP-binding protein [Planctomycetota bacterium]
MSALLTVRGLRTEYTSARGVVRAVDGVDLEVAAGETLCLVGESGCGKTAIALSIARLLPTNGRIAAGEIQFEGRDLARLDERSLRSVRGARIGFVFQEPLAALDPVFPIGEQIAEVLRAHTRCDRRAARARAVQLLERVEIARAAERASAYPHELSGGERQRALIATAIAAGPALLLADEPTASLDATVREDVLDLLDRLRRESRMAVLLVTHDLALAARRADRIAVMYAGRIVEIGPATAVIARPRHPYTAALVASSPAFTVRGTRLVAIPGRVPSAHAWPTGCRFRERCSVAHAECATFDPTLVRVSGEHAVACPFGPVSAEREA